MASGERRRTELLRGVLDLCLLAVMQEGPAYGYEMTKRLRARGLSIVGEGSIYPLLGRLERAGLAGGGGAGGERVGGGRPLDPGVFRGGWAGRGGFYPPPPAARE